MSNNCFPNRERHKIRYSKVLIAACNEKEIVILRTVFNNKYPSIMWVLNKQKCYLIFETIYLFRFSRQLPIHNIELMCEMLLSDLSIISFLNCWFSIAKYAFTWWRFSLTTFLIFHFIDVNYENWSTYSRIICELFLEHIIAHNIESVIYRIEIVWLLSKVHRIWIGYICITYINL